MPRALHVLLVFSLAALLSACGPKVSVVDKSFIGKKDVHMIVSSDDVDDPKDFGDAFIAVLRELGISVEEVPKGKAFKQSGSGSGFVVADGYWVTNDHVTRGLEQITVSIPGRDIPLTLVDSNPEVDLAILKGDTSGLKPIKIGTAEMGEEVVVVGYPVPQILSDAIRVTTGVVNSLDGFKDHNNRIQFSAPIQGGNSGGPMVGDNWELAGVVVATLNIERNFTRMGAYPQGMNMAVSPNDLKGYLLQHGIEQQGPYVQNLDELMASTGLMWNGDINKAKRYYVLDYACIWHPDFFYNQIDSLRIHIIDLMTGDLVAKGTYDAGLFELGKEAPIKELLQKMLKELQWL